VNKKHTKRKKKKKKKKFKENDSCIVSTKLSSCIVDHIDWCQRNDDSVIIVDVDVEFEFKCDCEAFVFGRTGNDTD
jgi:hypothetical protein